MDKVEVKEDRTIDFKVEVKEDRTIDFIANTLEDKGGLRRRIGCRNSLEADCIMGEIIVDAEIIEVKKDLPSDMNNEVYERDANSIEDESDRRLVKVPEANHLVTSLKANKRMKLPTFSIVIPLNFHISFDPGGGRHCHHEPNRHYEQIAEIYLKEKTYKEILGLLCYDDRTIEDESDCKVAKVPQDNHLGISSEANKCTDE
ncbi:hypothetical protein ACH5RR_033724 [Cinchona calisaya]|uniref:Uncharacterized protein n=1 Tax=Cinchona calisaya TaxID=153742 RepID=A0ABD2YE84_9GENT